MEIFEELRLDHLRLRNLLDDLIHLTSHTQSNAETDEAWAEAFFNLKQNLNAHDRAEENVFYEALTRVPNRRELADIKTEEHHQFEETLQELELIHPETPEWSQMLSLLKNQFDSHVAEEETSVFGLLQGVLTDEECEQMGADFQQLREQELIGNGYRLRLRSSAARDLRIRP